MKVGQIVHITFLDHAHHNEVSNPGLIECEVFGRVVLLDKDCVTVGSWLVKDTTNAQGCEMFSVGRRLILKQKILAR